jgi:hypothetical protein
MSPGQCRAGTVPTPAPYTHWQTDLLLENHQELQGEINHEQSNY